jgi:hypothetical protein
MCKLCNPEIVKAIKVRENNLEKLPVGSIIDVFDDGVPDGYVILENAEIETINEDPPEIGFWETLKLIFGRK